METNEYLDNLVLPYPGITSIDLESEEGKEVFFNYIGHMYNKGCRSFSMSFFKKEGEDLVGEFGLEAIGKNEMFSKFGPGIDFKLGKEHLKQ